VFGPSQRPLPDTQHSQDTSIFPAGFERTFPACYPLQTHGLDLATTANKKRYYGKPATDAELVT